MLRPIRVAPRGSWPPLRLLIQPPPPPLGFGFCLVHFCQEQDAVLRLWNPNRELNHLFSVNWLLLRALACVLRFAGKSKLSWRGRPTAAWLITIGFVVLRLRGQLFGSEAGSVCLESVKSIIILNLSEDQGPSSYQQTCGSECNGTYTSVRESPFAVLERNCFRVIWRKCAVRRCERNGRGFRKL